jgi:hypothetical protein
VSYRYIQDGVEAEGCTELHQDHMKKGRLKPTGDRVSGSNPKRFKLASSKFGKHGYRGAGS